MKSVLTRPPSIEQGSLCLFQQTAAPLGWTKQTAHNDKALRVVSGTAGSGGSSAFSTVFGKSATDNHTLTSTQMPSHNHGGGSHSHAINNVTGVRSNQNLVNFNMSSDADGGNQSTSSSGTIISSNGSGGAHSHNIDIRVNYVDLIIAKKD